MRAEPDTPVRGTRFVERRLYVTAVLVFVAAAGVTLSSARMMSGGMPMPGGWTMTMAWMRMPGQRWIDAGGMFAGMWLAMMVAMMLPSSLPMVLLYRRAIRFRGDAHPAALTWAMSAAYFVVWTLFGVLAYAAGVLIAEAAMRSSAVSRSVPIAAGAALILAGVYQLTSWKSACLTHCRNPLELVAKHLHRGWRGAIRLGLHHGLYCIGCCWALMLMQLVMGVMNLGAMVVIASVIALEKLTRRGETLARVVGVTAISAGMWMVVRAGISN
jgi:predicted metal-binding membrane protein